MQPVASVDYYGEDFMRQIQHQLLPRDMARAMLGQLPGYRDGGQIGMGSTAAVSASHGSTGTMAAFVTPHQAPVIVRVPVHESRSADVNLHGPVTVQAAHGNDFEDWARARAQRTAARYS